MSMISIDKMSKRFKDVQALKEISLEVNQGEVHGFIGPNGAGKTTTIRALLGIIRADAGRATIFGKDVWEEAVDIHKDIAYVPGDVKLWPNLTGGEVIDLLIGLRGKGNHSRKQELIERFQLDPSRKCRSYSKGNRQKVALVAALAVDAELYILDEPTSGLDPLMEQMFAEYIFQLRAEGKTVFLSSHILSEVEKLCDVMSIIREGEIIESGKIKDLHHLTRTNVRIESHKEIPSLSKQKGVHEYVYADGVHTFELDTEYMDELIKYISNYPVSTFESTPPKLEDHFMRHYRSDSG